MVTDGGERKGLLFWVIPGLPADSFLGKNVVTTMIAQKMQENRVWVSLTARRRELGLAALLVLVRGLELRVTAEFIGY